MGQTRMVLMYGAPLTGLVFDENGTTAGKLYELTDSRAEPGVVIDSHHESDPQIVGVCLTDPHDDLVISLDDASTFVTDDVLAQWQGFVVQFQEVLDFDLPKPSLWFRPVEVA